MKKGLILVIIILLIGSALYAATYVGGGITKELNGETQDLSIDGRITFGSGLSIDVDGSVSLSNPNPMEYFQLFTYLNLSIPISTLDLYAGFSPTIAFYDGQFIQEVLQEFGYVHAGIALRIKPLRVYVEAIKGIEYSSFSFFGLGISGGVQIGF